MLCALGARWRFACFGFESVWGDWFVESPKLEVLKQQKQYQPTHNLVHISYPVLIIFIFLPHSLSLSSHVFRCLVLPFLLMQPQRNGVPPPACAQSLGPPPRAPAPAALGTGRLGFSRKAALGVGRGANKRRRPSRHR